MMPPQSDRTETARERVAATDPAGPGPQSIVLGRKGWFLCSQLLFLLGLFTIGPSGSEVACMGSRRRAVAIAAYTLVRVEL